MSRANFVQVQLAAAATDIQTTLSVKAPVGGFVLPPADGGRLVLTDSPGRPLAFEVISYTSRSGSGPYTLNGVTRGLEGTVGLAWGIDTFAMQSLTAGELEEIITGREPAIAAGTTAQYRRGDKTWQDLATAVRAAVMTGLSTATATAVSATDSLLAAIGKLQAQITGLSTSKLDASANAVSATKLQTARTVTLSGDVTGSTTFDGTANVTISASFKDSGVASGTYTKVTVDQKGNVTAGSALLASDVPTLNQDTTGNAGTATKLQTSRTINGVSFDGTANITVVDNTKEPAFAAGTTAQYRRGDKTWQDFATAVRASVMTGLSTVTATAVSATDTLLAAIGKLQAQITGLDTSKLDATANAVSASKLATARSIALAGDVTGSATFDGSSNVSITATVANDSHTHDTRYPVLSAERVLASVPAGSWVTIAQVPSQGGRAYGEFIVYDTDSGKHSIVKIIASHSYGQSVVACVGGNRFGTRTIAHVRVLYGTVDRTYDGAKLQVYIENTCTLRVRALMINQISGWSAWSEMTPVVEGTPAGWAEDTTTRYDDITNTASGFSGSFSGSGALLTGLNAANLASGTIPDARLSGTYTGVNITGNAATATALQTARTINGVSFNGTSNITIADSTKLPLAGGSISGYVTFTTREAGIYGTYDSTKIDSIWSMGTSYRVAADGSTFGSLYGMAYKHTNNTAGGTMAAGHQIVFCSNGSPGVAIGLAGNVWNSGVYYGSGAGLTSVPAASLSGVVPDANLSGSYTGVSITGNAGTATKLATARTINGVSFDGTANITLPNTDGTPAGAVMAFARSTAPAGWLKANGSAISRTTYSALFAAIGTTFGAGDGSTTFNLPDMRGEFIRGWDDGRGVDSGRGFGSVQADMIGAHTHTVKEGSNQPGGSGETLASGDDYTKTVAYNSTSGSTGGAETRPRNLALLMCIKF